MSKHADLFTAPMSEHPIPNGPHIFIQLGEVAAQVVIGSMRRMVCRAARRIDAAEAPAEPALWATASMDFRLPGEWGCE